MKKETERSKPGRPILLSTKLHARLIENCDKHGIGPQGRARLIKWAEQVEMSHGLLQAFIQGHAEIICWLDGEPGFSLTDEGVRYVEHELLPKMMELQERSERPRRRKK